MLLSFRHWIREKLEEIGWMRRKPPEPTQGEQEQEKLQAEIAELDGDLRGFQAQLTNRRDELENLKAEIRAKEETIRLKKIERDRSTGQNRKIVEGELCQLLNEAKNSGRPDILLGSINSMSTLVDQVKVMLVALKGRTIPPAKIQAYATRISELMGEIADMNQEIERFAGIRPESLMSTVNHDNLDDELTKFFEENPNLESVSHLESQPAKPQETAATQNVAKPLTE